MAEIQKRTKKGRYNDIYHSRFDRRTEWSKGVYYPDSVTARRVDGKETAKMAAR